MNDKNTILIQGWMINELKLKGNELLVYALIYGFSQDGESKFYGNIDYIAKSIGGGEGGERKISSILKNLLERGLIKKELKSQNGFVKKYFYTAATAETAMVATAETAMADEVAYAETADATTAETADAMRRNCNGAIAETADDNNIYISNTKINKKIVKRTSAFIPPTLEQVKNYARENNADFLAEKFYKHFTAGEPHQHWIDSKGVPVRNWKQKFLTWLSHNSVQSSKPPDVKGFIERQAERLGVNIYAK